jgi:hypothetical protein
MEQTSPSVYRKAVRVSFRRIFASPIKNRMHNLLLKILFFCAAGAFYRITKGYLL